MTAADGLVVKTAAVKKVVDAVQVEHAHAKIARAAEKVVVQRVVARKADASKVVVKTEPANQAVAIAVEVADAGAANQMSKLSK